MNKQKKAYIGSELSLILTVYLTALFGFFDKNFTVYALIICLPFLVFALYNIFVSKTL